MSAAALAPSEQKWLRFLRLRPIRPIAAYGLRLARDISTMVSRVCAAWLVLLVLLPFSAPFSTCDLESLLANGGGQMPHHSQRHTHPIASLADAATTHALPLTRTTDRSKLVASLLHSLIRRALVPGSPAAGGTTPPAFSSSSHLSPLRI
jgi:hypothetical protein